MSDRIVSHYKVVIKHAETGATLRTIEPVKDRRFVYEYEWNKADHGGQASRDFVFELTAVDDAGNESEPQVVNATNPPPPAPLGLSVEQVSTSVKLTAVPDPEHSDVVGLMVWMSDTSGFTPSSANLRYVGPGLQAFVPTEGAVGTRYLRAAIYDSFGYEVYNLSDEASVDLDLQSLDEVLADIDEINDEIDQARDNMFDALGVVQSELNENLRNLPYASRLLGQTAGVASLPSLLNWIEYPRSSIGWVISQGGVLLDLAQDEGGFSATWNSSASGDPTLWFPDSKPLREGQRVQAGINCRLGNGVSSASLQAVFYNEADGVLSTEVIATGSGPRLEGFAEAPDGCAKVRISLAPVFSGDTVGGLYLSEPLAAYALPGQEEVRDYQPPESELVAQINELRRVVGQQADFERSLTIETREARASVYQVSQALVEEGEARASLETALQAVQENLEQNYLTIASAEETYLVEADLNQALALYENSVAARFTNITDNYITSSEVSENYLALSNVNSTLANYNLNLNSTFNSFANSTVKTVIQLSTPPVGNYKSGDIWFQPSTGKQYYHNGSGWVLSRDIDIATTAWAAQNFTTSAQVDQAIADYELTIGAVSGTLSAFISQQATAIAGLENTAARYQLVAAATGGEPAAIELLSAPGGSAASVVSERVLLKTSSEGQTTVALRAENGIVEIPNELRVTAGGAIRVAAGGASDPMVLLGNWGTGWGLRCWDGAKWVVDLDPINETFLIDGATLKNATIDGLKMVDGAVGSVGRALDDHHDFMTGTNPSSAASFSTKTLTTSALLTKSSDAVELTVSWTMQAQAGAMNWLYYDVDILRGGTVIWTKEFTHQAGQSVNAVSQNQIGAGDTIPQVISITTEDPSPTDTSSATYALRFRPRSVNGAFVEGLNTGLASTIDLKDMSIIAKAFRSGPFQQ